jgi:ribose transport system substrate-binding protein
MKRGAGGRGSRLLRCSPKVQEQTAGKSKVAGKRRRVGATAAVLFVLLIAFLEPASLADEGSPGITAPMVLSAFDPGAARCGAPPGLTKVLAFAQDNERDFMEGVRRGLAAAAKDRGLDFRVEAAGNDAARMNEQIDALRREHVGAIVASPVDPISLAPHLQQMIWSGSFVGTVVPPPATLLLNAPQYLTGRVLGDTAADYIRSRLGGRAKVVLLTHDSLQFLAPRFVAMREALGDMPGVTIVADISPATVNKEGGLAMMRTILLAQPQVDVVLGADTVVLGALAALREAGAARPDQFLGGIDGEPEAVAEIKNGNGPYKASVSLASPVFGYAMGQYAADWLEGKSVPQAMDILPKALTLANISQYEADVADPAAVFREPIRRNAYLRAYGNICYDTRDRYLNFPWSSEMR